MSMRTHEFNTVHSLATDPVRQVTKAELTEEGTDRVSYLDTEVLVGCASATDSTVGAGRCVVDIA